MSSVRILPLGAPVGAALWAGGDLGSIALSVVGLVVLLLVGRSVHHRLGAAEAEGPGRHHAP
jgi:hypothetical protein